MIRHVEAKPLESLYFEGENEVVMYLSIAEEALYLFNSWYKRKKSPTILKDVNRTHSIMKKWSEKDLCGVFWNKLKSVLRFKFDESFSGVRLGTLNLFFSDDELKFFSFHYRYHDNVSKILLKVSEASRLSFFSLDKYERELELKTF